METITKLIKLPFDILNNAVPENQVGYALLMIIALIGIIVLSSYILDFINSLIKSLLGFFNTALESVTGIFKGIRKKEFRNEMLKLNQKIDNISTNNNSIFPE